MVQTIIVAIVVLIAVAWIVGRAVEVSRGDGGCASCDRAGSCPFAGGGSNAEVGGATDKDQGADE